MNNKSYSSHIPYLILNLSFYRIFTRLPWLLTRDCGTAAPLAAALSGLIALSLISLLFLLYRKCGCLNIIDVAEKHLGSFGKILTATVLVIYMLASSAYALRDFSRLTSQIAFPTTPLWFIATFIISAALIAALTGIVPILRTHALLIPFLLTIITVVIFSALFYGKSDNLFPILGSGTLPLVRSSLSSTLLYSDIILIFLLNPANAKPTPKPFFVSVCVGVVLTVLLVFSFTATVIYPESLSVDFPIYQLLKTVWYGRFFQRLDAILMVAMLLSGMLYLATVLWLTASTTARCCRVKNGSEKRLHRIYSCISAVLIFVCAVSFGIFSSNALERNFFSLAAVAVAITALMFSIGFIAKRGTSQ